MDLLGYYIAQGMYFSAKELTGLNALSITGLSSDVDRYMFERFEAGMSPVIPQPPMPPGFARFIEAIEQSGLDYAVDCAIALLNLSYAARGSWQQSSKRRQQHKPRVSCNRFGGNFDDGNTGISFSRNSRLYESYGAFRKDDVRRYRKEARDSLQALGGVRMGLRSGKEFDTLGYLSYGLSSSELDELIRRAP